MQAQHYAKTKMDYLVFNGYNSLAVQDKISIESTEFKDCVALGTVSTDSNGISHRLVTVNVYKDDETYPRATLKQVFYSNDANKFVTNGSSATSSISMNYDKDNDRLYAMVDGQEKTLGGAGGVPVGTIIAWPFNAAPTEYGTWLLCDGSTYSAVAYPKLYALSKSATLPDLRDRFLQGSATAGKLVEAGLPNITGDIGISCSSNNCSSQTNGVAGRLIRINNFLAPVKNGHLSGSVYSAQKYEWIFDASLVNKLYGASTTVQPASYTVRYYIKAA